MNYSLPESVEVQGKEYRIRSDYRAILDILTAMADPSLDDTEKAIAALCIFYPDIEEMPVDAHREALEKCNWFIDCGEETDTNGTKSPRLMDWEQDFPLIVAPINRVLGKEVRSLDYLHWWSWISAYYEIGGDCTFAQVVSIRDRLARHKKLSKDEKEWVSRNQSLVRIKTKYSEAEENLLKEWI